MSREKKGKLSPSLAVDVQNLAMNTLERTSGSYVSFMLKLPEPQ